MTISLFGFNLMDVGGGRHSFPRTSEGLPCVLAAFSLRVCRSASGALAEMKEDAMLIEGTPGNDTLTGTPDDDIIVLGGGQDTVAAGDGNDEIVINANVAPGSLIDGGLGFDTLVIEPFPGFPSDAGPDTSGYVVTFPTLINNMEAVRFNSAAGSQLYLAVLRPVVDGGLTTLVGGDGADFFLDVVFAAGTYTMANFTLVNWTASQADPDHDTVQLRVSPAATGNFTLFAREGLASVQGLYGSHTTNDTLIGSSGEEYLTATGGLDLLYGNAGNDILAADNLTPFGQTPSTRSYAGDTFDGGSDFDILAIGGAANLTAASIAGIEELYLLPSYPAPGPGANARAPSVLTIGGDQVMTMLPSSLLVDGTGAIEVNAITGQPLNLSGWQFVAGSDVSVTINGTTGNDTITGTSGTDIINGHGGVDTINAGDGDDSIVIDTQPGFGTTYNGGLGFDSLVLTANPNGTAANGGSSTQYSVYYPTQVSGIEAVTYLSNPGDTFSLVMLHIQLPSTGLTTLVGGAGRDLFYDVVFTPGTYTMPNFSLVNWNNTPSDPNSDYVVLFASSGGNYTLNALEGLNALQGLSGNSGDDILNGSSGVEVLDGRGGVNQLYGNGGNDLLKAENLSFYGGGAESFTYLGTLFDGGEGTDTLLVGGQVNFQGTLVSVETIFFEAAYAPSPGINGLASAHLIITSGNFTLPSTARINGIGTLEINVEAGTQFSAADFEIVPGSNVAIVLNGAGGNEIITGSSGNDIIAGGAGFDNLTGGAGDDAIFGGDDGDFITADAGNDIIDGGSGFDYAMYDNAAIAAPTTLDFSTVSSSSGSYVVSDGRGGSDTVSNIEFFVLIGGSQGGTVTGASGVQNLLSGNAGNYTFTGGNLHDEIYTHLGDDIVFAGNGDDLVENDGGTDHMYGGAGFDTLQVQGEQGDYVLTYLGQGRWQVTPVGIGAATDGVSFLEGVEQVRFAAWATGNSSTFQLYTNAAPVAQDSIVDTAEDTALAGQVIASDIDSDGLIYALVSGPAHGSLVFDLATGAYLYTPELNWSGIDNFTFRANDGLLDSDVRVVTITVTPVNDAALIGGQVTGIVTESAAAGGVTQTTGALTVSDVDSPASFVAGSFAGTYGTLTLSAAGSWTYVLSNANPLVDGLSNGQSLSDTITVSSSDGTQQAIVVAINGANDLRTGSNGADALTGTTGADTLLGNGGNDTLNGGVGADTLDGGNGTDTATYAGLGAGVQVNLALAGPQNTGAGGIDTLISIENLTGTDHDDVLTGSGGANTLVGGAGDDTLDGGAGNDVLDGGSGVDTASFAASGARVTVNLASGGASGAGNDTLTSIENVVGSAFNDTLTGNAGANALTGGLGNDRLTGGGGSDALIGGSGADTFVFSALADSTAAAGDSILDFSRGDGDRIDLSAIDALPGGKDNAFSFIGSAAFSGAGQLRYTDLGSGQYQFQADVDGNGVADLQFVMTMAAAPIVTDFIL